MKRILGLLLLTAGLAHADPAILDTGTCALLDSDGATFTAGALRIVLTPNGTAAGMWKCYGQQDFRAGQAVLWNYDTTGLLCGIGTIDGFRLSARWQETVSASGRITLTCVTE